jgi:archaellum component FlaD/FlaE
MARKKAGKEKVAIILDEEDEDDDDIEPTGIRGGEVERYEVKVEPPIVSGRKSKVVRSGGEVEVPVKSEGGSVGPSGRKSEMPQHSMVSSASSQQIYKIEDDLRRTRDIVEDLKHTVSMMEGEFKDLKAEMDRISYMVRSLEGLRNTMKDIESTVSELSGLYDMISANVNPFIDIEPIQPSNGIGKVTDRLVHKEEVKGKESSDTVFSDISEIFSDEEDEVEELEETDSWDESDLRSAEWALRWTQFLIDKVSKEGLEKTLDYYRNLGWIDETLIDRVLEIARGTTGPVRKDPGKKPTWRMGAEDHVRSLEFIRRIKGT